MFQRACSKDILSIEAIEKRCARFVARSCFFFLVVDLLGGKQIQN